MQFADPSSTTHPYAEDLTSPQPMRADLPANLQRSRLIIACVLDREGTLKDAKVLHSGAAEVTHQVMAALPSWKFRPALRGNQPVEVNAIVGFGIDTR
jgi:TonB family protein